MRSSVAAVVVGVAAGKYNCPGSSSFSHASMKVTVDVDADCTSVQQEIEARASGSWVDPHNGGIYSVLSSSSGLINTQRTTNPATSVGGNVYTDKQTFELTPTDGGCQIKGCSESQGGSFSDFSTNYCDLRNLYCGSSDSCVTAGNDFTSKETSHSGSLGAGHDSSKCIVAATVEAAKTGPPPVSELDLTKYVGLWYQAYSSQSVVTFPEFGAKCVTAEYGVASDGAAVTVKNTVTLLGQRVSVQGIAVQSPNVTGVFQAHIGAPLFPVTKIPTYTPGNFDNYLIAAVGPVVDGKYDWAVVSDEKPETLYVLTRDLAQFEKYEAEVLQLIEDLGFTSNYLKPRKSYQENCNYGEEETMIV